MILALVPYAAVGRHPFISVDDPQYILDNPLVLQGLTLQGVIQAFTVFHASHWHPLTWISHMIDVELFGLNPGAHHLVNLLFHAANTLLVFAVFNAMTRKRWPSAFIALLFALHPLRVESVAWAAERKDVLCAFFYLLCLWCYQRYCNAPGRYAYLLVCLCCGLALLAKPMAVSLPVVLLLMDCWPLKRLSPPLNSMPSGLAGRANFKSLALEKLPLFLMVGLSCVLTYTAGRKGGAVSEADLFPLADRIANAAISYVKYLGKTIWPFDMVIYYHYPAVLPYGKAGLCALLIALVTMFCLLRAKKYPFVCVGWLWFLVTLAPVIGIVQAGSQSMADRFMYIPLIGLAICFAYGGALFVEKWPRVKPYFIASGVFYFTCMALLSQLQVRYWRSDIALFSHAVKVNPDNWMVLNNLGVAFSQKGRTAEAASLFKRVLEIHPEYGKARYNLSLALASDGKFDQAIHQCRILLRKGHFKDLDLHLHLGKLLLQTRDFKSAIEQFRIAQQMNPTLPSVYNNLGVAYSCIGDYGNAEANYRRAIEKDPSFSDPRRNLKKLMQITGATPDNRK